jgi:hypothetical protein
MIEQGQSTFWAFLLQALFLLSYIPVTFAAYKGLREPRKLGRAKWELSQVVRDDTPEFREAMKSSEYSLKQYLVPLAYIYLVLFACYGLTHPYVIGSGIWKGLLEEIVAVIGPSQIFATNQGIAGASRDILYGRFLFWCWLGAYVHSVERTVRHYLVDDLHPDIYVSSARRFIVALVVGTIVVVGVGVLADFPTRSANSQITIVYIVAFFTGLFPERGVRWVVTIATGVLRQREKLREPRKLMEIEGLSHWQRDRLEQEGVENLQNLATAELLTLIVRTPYDVGQIVDWVDQAILLVYGSTRQVENLGGVGIHRASDLLTAVQEDANELAEAAALGVGELRILHRALRSAANIKSVCHYRGVSEVLSREADSRVDAGDEPTLVIAVQPSP